ncbi:hypothetical protein EBR78_08360, partial [bacterium]|nr:hypothetical protein [bacterium]
NLAANLSDGLNQVWANSGLTTQDYQETKKELLNNLADSARAYAGGDISKLSTLGGNLLKAAAKITAGRNGEPLLDQVGGQKALADFYRRLMSGVRMPSSSGQRHCCVVVSSCSPMTRTEPWLISHGCRSSCRTWSAVTSSRFRISRI